MDEIQLVRTVVDENRGQRGAEAAASGVQFYDRFTR